MDIYKRPYQVLYLTVIPILDQSLSWHCLSLVLHADKSDNGVSDYAAGLGDYV